MRVGKHIELEVEAADEAGARAQVEEMAARLLSNPVIEDFRILETAERVSVDGAPASASSRSRARWTTGTRCARSTRWAGRASRCGTGTPTFTASTPSILPGGFSYGDYLRCGAHRAVRAR